MVTPVDMSKSGRTFPLFDPDDPNKALTGDLSEEEQLLELNNWILNSGIQGAAQSSYGIYKRDDGRWEVYIKSASSLDPTLWDTQKEADAEIARLMAAAGETGVDQWVSYMSETPGESGFRIRANPDVVDRIDPKKPLAQDPIDLGNGQSLFILSNGQTFTGPTGMQGFDDWDASENVQTIGDRTFAMLPDGTTVDVSKDKVYGAGDLTIVENIAMQDGSTISIMSDGSKLSTGPAKPPTAATMGESGYWEVRDANGNLSLKQPLYETGIDYTDAGFNILSGPQGPIEDLGLPEVPSTIETIGGQQFIRGTQGELEGLDGALDRAIDYAIISGQGDKARAWNDFKNRPDSLTALNAAMEWARTPGDQALISDLHYMTSGQAAAAGEAALGRGAGFFSEVAPPPQFAQDAYKRFQDSITGGSLPTEEDFAAALAMEEEPPPRTMREQLEDELAQSKIDAAQAEIDRKDEIHDALMISNKAESDAKVKAIQEKGERDALAFTNEQDRLDQALSADITRKDSAAAIKVNGEQPPAGAQPPAGEQPPDTPAGSKWVYHIGNDKWILDADGTFDVSAQGAGTFLLEGDPGAPDISLYDTTVNEDTGAHTGTGLLKEPKEPASPAVGGDTTETAYNAADHKGDYNMDGEVDQFELVRWNEDENNPKNAYVAPRRDPGDEIYGTTAEAMAAADTGALPLAGATGIGALKDLIAYNQPTAPADRTAINTMSEEEAVPLPTPQASGALPDLDAPEDVPGPVTLGSGRTLAEAQASGIHQQAGDGIWSGPSFAPITSGTGEPTGISFPTPASIPNLGKAVASSLTPGVSDIYKNIYSGLPGPSRKAAADWERRHQAEAARGVFNEGAYGTRTDDRITLVGESGPELALFPNGTEIIPLDRDMKPDQKKRLRRRGVRGMQEGGLVFDREPSRGISQFISGREVGPSQGRIFRRAGFTTPSAQALRNILPEELEEFRTMGARARIHEGTFERELAQGIASGDRRSNSARFLPLSLRS